MESESYKELLELINDSSFDIFSCIQQLKVHANNIGVCHYLVLKLHQYTYHEIEFYIPQLLQILVSYESDSMALSDFILEYSERYPHFCLVVFWYLQAFVFELKDDPQSYSFHVVRNFINQLQGIMFNFDTKPILAKHSFRENLSPSLVLGGMIAASFGAPSIQSYIKPIILSQSKQQKTFLFKLANFHKALTKNLTMKNRGITTPKSVVDSDDNKTDNESNETRTRSLEYEGSNTNYVPVRYHSEDNSHSLNSKLSTNTPRKDPLIRSNSLGNSFRDHSNLQSHSMPDLRDTDDDLVEENNFATSFSNASTSSLASLEVSASRIASPKRSSFLLTHEQKVKCLHVNYFKQVTEFMMTLQNISTRLSLVPRDARLSSLRAELAIINNTLLPSEIDIPQLLPISSKQNKKFHKILKLNINEACVLNSAERVPFLLLIEYLSEEMDFDPLSDYNTHILQRRSDQNYKKEYNEVNGVAKNHNESNGRTKKIEEADLGDISVVELSNERDFITNHLSMKQSSDMSQNLKESPIVEDPKESSLTTVQMNNLNLESKKINTKDLSTQMRIAAVMLQQLEKSGRANSQQSISIKSRIIESMKALQDNFESIDYQQISELHVSTSDAGERKLENDFKLGEDWSTKKNRIRKASCYGHLKNWDLCSVIAKNGDDLPQEAFACQLIGMISNIWKRSNVGVWTKNMKILITSANTGLVETINNAMSIHSIKKSLTEISVSSGENPKGLVASLEDYFRKVYGDEDSTKYKKAQDNFAKSLAAYSVICYVLQIKDRHNGNIMLDNEGHIIHIDFGFLLSNSPGSVGFEAAPFKLTGEYVDLLGGTEGKPYLKFKSLCKDAFRALRKNSEQLINIVDLMQKDSSLPCFSNGAQTSVLLKQRLQLDLTDAECDTFVETALIGKSVRNFYTRLYDQYQLITQGIYS